MEQILSCPNCHLALDPGVLFCGNCGQSIAYADANQPPSFQSVIQSYAPKPEVSNQMYTNTQAISIGSMALPAYALAPLPRRHDHMRLVIAVILGGIGIGGAFLLPLLGLILGVIGVVLITLAPKFYQKMLKLGGIGICSLAIILALGNWVIAVNRTNTLEHKDAKLSAAPQAAGEAQTIATPCYAASFGEHLTVQNQYGSCAMNAYNGASFAASSEIYKVISSSAPSITAANFQSFAEQAVLADVAANLPGFRIITQGSSQFATSPDFQVQAVNSSGVAVIEAAVLHIEANQPNIYVLIHAISAKAVNLNVLAANWQWR